MSDEELHELRRLLGRLRDGMTLGDGTVYRGTEIQAVDDLAVLELENRADPVDSGKHYDEQPATEDDVEPTTPAEYLEYLTYESLRLTGRRDMAAADGDQDGCARYMAAINDLGSEMDRIQS
ncbi:hypothetical protein [Umezawaea sp. Da 62-37]|uniref:hypothetical protein n=1 Tax=Umezawaea sp. Da 62-37 TaxID=3075927 RepID=UPI0028F6E239|nr:hypothetical protein [Umezawaea sp. Da 62-37]WNV83146.1 hypothetical protein RM788_33850 [Umezawaea sp. Da 62-37]